MNSFPFTTQWRCLIVHLCAALAAVALMVPPTYSQTKTEVEANGDQETPPPLSVEAKYLRESNPSSPRDLFRSIRVLVDLREFQEATSYLQKLEKENIPDSDLVELHLEFGSGFFIRLARLNQLQPIGKSFGLRVLEAVSRHLLDPIRLRKSARAIQDSSVAVSRPAAEHLSQAGTAAVSPLLNELTRTTDEIGRNRLRGVLTSLGSQTVCPLIAATRANHPRVQHESILALGRLKDKQAIAFLVGHFAAGDTHPVVQQAASWALTRIVGKQPTLQESISILEKYLTHYQATETLPHFQPDASGSLTTWSWDNATETLVSRPNRPIGEALTELTALLATDLWRLQPDRQEYMLQMLVLALQAEKLSTKFARTFGPESSLFPTASVAGISGMQQVLQAALDSGRTGAAVTALEFLAREANSSILHDGTGAPGVLVEALQATDRRVQFAAAQTIMELDPRFAYPGSSVFLETIQYLVGSEAVSGALVIHPVAEQAQSWAGLLREVGYQAQSSTRSNHFLELAIACPDYEFLLISRSVVDVPAFELVHQLRQHPRTSKLPVVIIGMGSLADPVGFDPLTETVAAVPDAKAMRLLLNRFDRLRGDRISAYESSRQSAIAFGWLGHLTQYETTYNFYDFHRIESQLLNTLGKPTHSLQATKILGNLGSARAQEALLALARTASEKQPLRKAAANGLTQAISRHGMMLTRAQLQLTFGNYRDETSEFKSVLTNIDNQLPRND